MSNEVRLAKMFNIKYSFCKMAGYEYSCPIQLQYSCYKILELTLENLPPPTLNILVSMYFVYSYINYSFILPLKIIT